MKDVIFANIHARDLMDSPNTEIYWIDPDDREYCIGCGDYDVTCSTASYKTYPMIHLPFFSWGDYSGNGIIGVANTKYIEDNYPDTFLEISGDHGFNDILFFPHKMTQDLADLLGGLNEYPLLCETMHSQCKLDAENESWASWVKDDFIGQLEALFFVELKAAMTKKEEQKLYEFFSNASEKQNVYWEEQTSDILHIDTEKVAEGVDPKEFLNSGLIDNIYMIDKRIRDTILETVPRMICNRFHANSVTGNFFYLFLYQLYKLSGFEYKDYEWLIDELTNKQIIQTILSFQKEDIEYFCQADIVADQLSFC